MSESSVLRSGDQASRTVVYLRRCSGFKRRSRLCQRDARVANESACTCCGVHLGLGVLVSTLAFTASLLRRSRTSSQDIAIRSRQRCHLCASSFPPNWRAPCHEPIKTSSRQANAVITTPPPPPFTPFHIFGPELFMPMCMCLSSHVVFCRLAVMRTPRPSKRVILVAVKCQWLISRPRHQLSQPNSRHPLCNLSRRPNPR